MARHAYQVQIDVGGVPYVARRTTRYHEALVAYYNQVQDSVHGVNLAAHKPVTLTRNGETVKHYAPGRQ